MVKVVSTALFLSTVAGVALAGPVPLADGTNDGNSFTQQWNQSNDGSFNTILIEFVSHTDDSGDEWFGFKGSSIFNGGWTKTAENPTHIRGDGPSGNSFNFNLTFFSNQHSSQNDVVWNIWYYNNGVAGGGYRGTMTGNQGGLSWAAYDDGDAPNLNSVFVPLPSASALAGLGLVGIGCRRRRQSV